jgi:signal transduction histidine kinase
MVTSTLERMRAPEGAVTESGGSHAPIVKILAVDDRPENLVALRAVLDDADYHLVEERSGEDALRRLLREDFALVLLDVRMPGMDGFDVARLMRQRERTRYVPILFLTGEALDLGSLYRGYAAGAVDYLMKPLDPTVVRAKVAVFTELFRQRAEIRRQASLLRETERQIHALELAELKFEAEQREKEVLLEALRAREDFVTLASHELRSPLTPLLGHLQVLQRMAREARLDPERTARGLEAAVRQVHKLSRLVGQLLDSGLMRRGKLELSQEELDLSELAREVVELYADEARKVGAELRLSAPAPVIGRWDRTRIAQVFTNLVTNAMKFGAGKPIDVIVEEIAGGAARIAVRDRGIGIPPENAARIFDRFERAVSVAHYGGLGLGLYIVKEIVASHGGSIRVESAPGDGATFTVELPRAQCAAAPLQGRTS